MSLCRCVVVSLCRVLTVAHPLCPSSFDYRSLLEHDNRSVYCGLIWQAFYDAVIANFGQWPLAGPHVQDTVQAYRTRLSRYLFNTTTGAPDRESRFDVDVQSLVPPGLLPAASHVQASGKRRLLLAWSETPVTPGCNDDMAWIQQDWRSLHRVSLSQCCGVRMPV